MYMYMYLKLLENVQRRWTKRIDGMATLSYGDRLRSLNLYSIQGRLLRADLIQCWKFLMITLAYHRLTYSSSYLRVELGVTAIKFSPLPSTLTLGSVSSQSDVYVRGTRNLMMLYVQTR